MINIINTTDVGHKHLQNEHIAIKNGSDLYSEPFFGLLECAHLGYTCISISY
jgi:hypothetical protein